MEKIIFFDADGVTIVKREKYFSERLSLDYGVKEELVLSFFKNEFNDCILGKRDLKEVLMSYIGLWGWKGSVDDLLKYWWEGENKLNAPVIEYINNIRKQGIKCYLATDQEKYRANYLMENVGLKNHLDGAFFSCDVGVSKSTKEYWEYVLQNLKVENPNGVYYFDDEQENIDSAKSAGVTAYLYKDINDFKKML